MSAGLDKLVEMGIGVVAWCYNHECRRPSAYLSPARLAPFLGQGPTREDASRRMRCEACGGRGREGKFEILPSTMDVEDLRHGRPAGHSEAIRAAKLDAPL